MAFLNLNVYSPTAYDDAIFMPIASNAFKFYTFNLEGLETINGLTIYKIRFLPKQWSQKLVCGDLYVIDQSWTIDKIDMNGRYSFAEFNLVMSYGRDFRRFILPEKADLFLRYRVLGNAVATTYHSSFKYQEVEWVEEDNESHKWKSLDLTNYYKLSSDTVPIIRDSTYWNIHRDNPLSPDEAHLYSKAQEQNISKIDTADDLQKYVKLTEQLTNTVNMDYKTTRIKYSGFLNPFQLVIPPVTASLTNSDSVSARHSPVTNKFVSVRRLVTYSSASRYFSRSEAIGNTRRRNGESYR